MKDYIFELYAFLSEANIKNRLDSLYWLFSVQNLIVKQNGINKRYLKVYLFNRKFQEQNNLMQLTLNFHGCLIKVQQFQVAERYQDCNIMGFLHEIDLADSSEDVEIVSYIYDGVETVLQGSYLEEIEIKEDIHKMNITNDFLKNGLDRKMIMHPSFHQNYWICECGYVNNTNEETCTLCGCSVKTLKDWTKCDFNKIALENIKQKFVLSDCENIKTALYNLSEKCEKRYGVCATDVLDLFNKAELEKIQNEMIDKKIRGFLEITHFEIDIRKSFDDNLELYLKDLVNKVITKEKICTYINIENLKKEYNIELMKEEDRKRKKQKMVLACLAAGVIFISLLFIVNITVGNREDTNKVTSTSPEKVTKPTMKEKASLKEREDIHLYAGVYSTIAINNLGNIEKTEIKDSKYDNGQNDIASWTDIKEISSEQFHTVGLKKDGTVISTYIKDAKNDTGQSNISTWKDMKQVSAATYNTVGLKKDGTVISTEVTDKKYDYGQTDVSKWENIIQISAAWDHTVGLRKDGTVVSTKINSSDFDYGETNVESWTDIVYIASASNHTIGIKRNGDVVATGYSGDGRCDVSNWKDIVSVSVGRYHTLGLQKNGKVLSTLIGESKNDFGQNQTTNWSDISKISAGWFHSVGLKKDGTVVSTTITKQYEDMGQTDIHNWMLNREDK